MRTSEHGAGRTKKEPVPNYGNQLAPWMIKKLVRKSLKRGSMFMAPADAYNTDFCHQLSAHWVVDFSRNVVLTTDWCGRPESFQYYDVYKMLRGRINEDKG